MAWWIAYCVIGIICGTLYAYSAGRFCPEWDWEYVVAGVLVTMILWPLTMVLVAIFEIKERKKKSFPLY